MEENIVETERGFKNLKELFKDISRGEWSEVSYVTPIERIWTEEDRGRLIEIRVFILSRENVQMNINDLDAKDVHSEAHFHIDAHLINGIIQGFHIRTRMIPTDLLGDPKVASMIDSKLANKIRSGKMLTPEEQSMLAQVDIPKSKWSGKELLKKVLDFYSDYVKAIEEDYMTGNHLVSINNYINKHNLPLPEGVVSKGEEYERGGESIAGSALIVAENTIKDAIRNGMWHGVVLQKLGMRYTVNLQKFLVKGSKVRRVAFRLTIGKSIGGTSVLKGSGKIVDDETVVLERIEEKLAEGDTNVMERIDEKIMKEDRKNLKKIDKKLEKELA